MITSVLGRSSRPVLAVPEDYTVENAVKLMASRNVRRLVVTASDGSVTGIFSVQSLLAMVSEGADLASASLLEAGLERPVYVSPEAAVIEAVRVMGDRGVTSVLVGNEGEQPLGIFTSHDVVLELSLSSYGSAPISDVARRYPSLAPDAELSEAARVMATSGTSGVLVADGDSVVGAVTLRQILQVMAEGNMALRGPTSQVAGWPLALVDMGGSVGDAARSMTAKGIDLAVVLCGGRPCGAVDDLSLTAWLSRH